MHEEDAESVIDKAERKLPFVYGFISFNTDNSDKVDQIELEEKFNLINTRQY